MRLLAKRKRKVSKQNRDRTVDGEIALSSEIMTVSDSENYAHASSATATSAMNSNNTDSYPSEADTGGGEISPNKLVAFWRAFVVRWKAFTASLYDATVVFLANFIADILCQPRLQKILEEVVVAAINGFMKQEDIGAKMDDTARKVIYDRDKAKEASRAIGKEVVPMVTGFVGGFADSLTPAGLKRRKEKRRKERFPSNLTAMTTTSSPPQSGDCLTEGEEGFGDDDYNNGEEDGFWRLGAKKVK
mmetsp:Transcript_28691/g.61566  ORF Transcript_28691/g.61566 Transcript_28691/m.61566 type:complete len:246 (+) Transcript_28691:229-966(+)